MEQEHTFSIRPSASAPITSNAQPGSLQLWHGTDLESARWIAEYGLSSQRMSQYYPLTSEFWATTCLLNARDYSFLNIAVNEQSGVPAVVGITIPMGTVEWFLRCNPPLASTVIEDKAYSFMPGCFKMFNAAVTETVVFLTSEIKLEE